MPAFKRLGQADRIDDAIDTMLARKTIDEVSDDMTRLMSTFQAMDEQGFTPNEVKSFIADKKVVVTPEEAHYVETLFAAYWKATHGG
ncbi:hypothetical protein GN244_ATG10960 [Phytophthora infestans]|nr:hypothetical protein GN244_ATG10960 [Phytophthora infestans]KAF4149083.1 hypothetical protein GN958_ATG01736 [Phytophthora infestans]